MKKFIVGLTSLALFCMVFALGVKVAFASYPDRPIRIIVPFPPGATNDARARIIAKKLADSWGVSVIVENKAGADGAIGHEAAAKAKPDGYTLILATVGTLAIHPSLYTKTKYHPIKDYAPITQFSHGPVTMSADPTLSAKSLKELIALAKSKPGELVIGYAGTEFYLAGVAFMREAGIKLRFIPYPGGQFVVTAVMSHEVPLMISSLRMVLSHAEAGTIRPLGLLAAERSKAMPGLPTMVESGFPGLVSNMWSGLLAPAGTPKEIVKKLNTEIIRILHLPDINKLLTDSLETVIGNTPEEFAAVIKADNEKYSRLIKEAKIPLLE